MIDQKVLDAYVARFPDLKILATRAAAGHIQAEIAFARNACRLEAPPGVSAQQLWELAAQAK